MTSQQLIAFLGTVLTVVVRDLIAYAGARRAYINAVDANQFPLPPRPTFDWVLFLISLLVGISGGLAVFGVNVSVGN